MEKTGIETTPDTTAVMASEKRLRMLEIEKCQFTVSNSHPYLTLTFEVRAII